MTKTVLIYGLIAGVISAGLMWILMLFVSKDSVDFDSGMLWGYATMIVALSFVFFGIKSYRDKMGGRISFFRGLLIGILITLISGVCYASSWEVYHMTGRDQEFMQRYTAYYRDKMKQNGASDAELEKARIEGEQ